MKARQSGTLSFPDSLSGWPLKLPIFLRERWGLSLVLLPAMDMDTVVGNPENFLKDF
jgi:hypothetical protein